MIYTVTFNPSLDYIVTLERFIPGQVNRTQTEMMLPGGKGINVSMVLKNMGIESTALGFTAGFTGAEIQKRVGEAGCSEEFITLSHGMSRINVKMKAGEESELNGRGPAISRGDIDKIVNRLSLLEDDDILVLAGSIPDTIPDTIYSDIMEKLSGRGVKIVVDATRDLLANVLKFHPFLVKPNHHELGELFGVALRDKDEVAAYAVKLRERGAKNVLVSMAGDGAVLADEHGRVQRGEAPRGKVVNSVGAGDSMVAGFLAGYLEDGTYERAFRMGIAAGSASAFSKNLATKPEIDAIFKTLNV